MKKIFKYTKFIQKKLFKYIKLCIKSYVKGENYDKQFNEIF